MRYGNLLIEGIVSTHGSATDAVNADTLAFELGSATAGNANGGSLTFKPGAGFGTGTDGNISILPTSNGSSVLALYDAAGTAFAGFKAAATMAGNVTWTLPNTDGLNNQVLTTNGTGALSWVTVPLTGYINVAGDTGTAQADITTDTIKFAGGTGIATVAVDGSPDTLTISFTNHNFTEKAVPVLADQIVIFDSANSDAPAYTTFSDALNSLDVVYGIAANGFVVRTANDTYASRTIAASTVAGQQGVVVTNGDGVAANPTVGFDINGLTAGTSVTTTTEFAAFDGTNNVKVSAAQIFASCIVRGTFTDASLTTGVLAISHNLNAASVLVQIYDDSSQQILPDTITLTDANTSTVDLSSYGAIAGTWSYIIFG